MSLYTEKYFLYNQWTESFWIVFDIGQLLKESDLILYLENSRKWEKVLIRGLETQMLTLFNYTWT